MTANSIVYLGVVDSKFALKVDELEKDWTHVIETSVLLAEKQLLFAKRVKSLWAEAQLIDAKKKTQEHHQSFIREKVQNLIGSTNESIFSRWQKIGEFADALMPYVDKLPPSRDTLYQLTFAVEEKKPYKRWIRENKITTETTHQRMQTLVKGVDYKAKVVAQKYMKVTLFFDGETSPILKLLRPVLMSKMTKLIDADSRLKKAINDDLQDAEKASLQGKLHAKK
jgi:hypothetical protein